MHSVAKDSVARIVAHADGRRLADVPDPAVDDCPCTAPIEKCLRGALRLAVQPDGLVVPQRFNKRQLKAASEAGRLRRAVATSGVCIDFVTTGDKIAFDCRVVSGLDPESSVYQRVMETVGDIGNPADGLIDGIDVVVVGGNSLTLPVADGRVIATIDNPGHDPLEVRVYLPCIMCVAVGNLAANGPIAPAPGRGYLLALGDSITQGFVVGSPSLTYPAKVAQTLGLDVVNQGIAGHVFDPHTLEGLEKLRKNPPAVITVAYGTNDWSHGASAKRIYRNATAYLDALEAALPDVPIYVMSPLWRADESDEKPCGRPFRWMHAMLRDIARDRDGVTVVDGYEAMPHNPLMFSDGTLHPGSVGADLVATALAGAMDRFALRTDASGVITPKVAGGVPGVVEAPSTERVDEAALAMPGAPGRQEEVDRLVRTVWRLRQPEGCPWDARQTHESLTRFMVEEAYEAAEAMREGDPDHIREELGDVLYQVLLNAQVSADEGGFDISDVARDLNLKLVRRHPHVFGGAKAKDPDQVRAVWEDVKRRERESAAAGDEAPRGLLDSVPASLPALMQCQKISARAAKAGFEWASEADVWDQVASERAELEAERLGSDERTMEFGDLLFALVNVARWEGIDAEEALQRSNAKFRSRWARVERMASESGVRAEDLSTAGLNGLWSRAKAEEKHERPRG